MKALPALAAICLLAAAALALASGAGRRAAEAGLLLSDVAAGGGPSLLKRLTPRPARQAVQAGPVAADLYLPAEKARAGLVLVPGADRAGKDHPRLVALAESLARLRFLVLVPDIASLRDLDVSADDRHPIAAAARWLADERHPPRVGVAAISYAVLPAVLAALDQPSISFILGIGGAYDLTATTTFVTTGFHRQSPGAPWQYRQPNAYGKWVFVRSNARRMDNPADRAGLAAIAGRRMADADASIDDLLPGLTAQGRAVMTLLNNTDPDRVPDLLAALPSPVGKAIAALDLAPRDLSGLQARLVLIHGRTDGVVPWTESAALARIAPAAQVFIPDNLAHAELRSGSLDDTLTLWLATQALLKSADS